VTSLETFRTFTTLPSYNCFVFFYSKINTELRRLFKNIEVPRSLYPLGAVRRRFFFGGGGVYWWNIPRFLFAGYFDTFFDGKYSTFELV
jgi:hypothetical protein